MSHSTYVDVRYLDDKHVRVLPWPAFSPDLSPVEHLWDVFDRRARRLDPQNAGQLEKCLRQEWDHEIQNFIRSIR